MIAFTVFFTGCVGEDDCINDHSLDVIDHRSYHMGCSTWSYSPDSSDALDTYQFLAENTDIYAEQIDNHIPWNAWIENTSLPEEFIADIDFRVEQRLPDHNLLLSISLLNTD